MNQPSNENSSVSFIIEQDIPSDKTQDFIQWQSQIIQASHQFPGYLGTDNFPPTSGIRDKWYTVIHFDTPEHLTQWLESEVRHQLMKDRKDQLGFYRFIAYKTSFEEWLRQQNNLPKWKQALAVLLGLYPTVMIETLLLSHWQILESWSLASTLLIKNLMSCFVLTWLVMPFVRNLLKFWLEPKRQSITLDSIGTLLILIGLILMLSVFTAIK